MYILPTHFLFVLYYRLSAKFEDAFAQLLPLFEVDRMLPRSFVWLQGTPSELLRCIEKHHMHPKLICCALNVHLSEIYSMSNNDIEVSNSYINTSFWMFIFSHFHASVNLTRQPFMPQNSNKNIRVQVDQSQNSVVIHTGACVSVYAHRVSGSNVKNLWNRK